MTIEAAEFVEAARKIGFYWYAGVPCSFLTPFINYVINDDGLTYIASANEGDAVATAAGATIAGKRAAVMMQNSGLGNAINPLTSLAHTFRIPLLLICTLRGDRNFQDEPQHELMGRITEKLFETMGIPWAYFPTTIEEIAPTLTEVDRYLQRESRPYALIMRKGTIAPHPLKQRSIVSPSLPRAVNYLSSPRPELPTRQQALTHLLNYINSSDTLTVATTGYTGRELFALDDRANRIYMVGSMGCASSLALGLSLARPDLNTVIIDGDGAALMRMGNFATIGAYARGNLTHILLDNQAHDSTGAQATVSASVDFACIASACGYGASLSGNNLESIDSLFDREAVDRPRFLQLKIKTGTVDNLPRPNLTPEAALRRTIEYVAATLV
jgi:phosphonopyruvate decarboxylase